MQFSSPSSGWYDFPCLAVAPYYRQTITCPRCCTHIRSSQSKLHLSWLKKKSWKKTSFLHPLQKLLTPSTPPSSHIEAPGRTPTKVKCRDHKTSRCYHSRTRNILTPADTLADNRSHPNLWTLVCSAVGRASYVTSS